MGWSSRIWPFWPKSIWPNCLAQYAVNSVPTTLSPSVLSVAHSRSQTSTLRHRPMAPSRRRRLPALLDAGEVWILLPSTCSSFCPNSILSSSSLSSVPSHGTLSLLPADSTVSIAAARHRCSAPFFRRSGGHYPTIRVVGQNNGRRSAVTLAPRAGSPPRHAFRHDVIFHLARACAPCRWPTTSDDDHDGIQDPGKFEENHIATGFGNHMAVPILRGEWREDLTFEESCQTD